MSILRKILQAVNGLVHSLLSLTADVAKVKADTAEIKAAQAKAEAAQALALDYIKGQFDLTLTAIQQVINLLTINEPVSFKIKFVSGVTNMTGMKFTTFDDGSALAVLVGLDKVGNETALPDGISTPVWTISNPDVAISPATDGLSALLKPNGPLAKDVVATATFNLADGTPEVANSDAFDVIADKFDHAGVVLKDAPPAP